MSARTSILAVLVLALLSSPVAAEEERQEVEALVAQARSAWSRRQDDEAQRLAQEALALDAENAEAHRLLGHARTADGWTEGLPAPWGARGTTGPRWGSERRKAGPRLPAVKDALDWLAAHQDEDGRVDADGFSKHCPEGDVCTDPGGGHHGERVPCAFDTVTTAVAVMAWLADGSTPTSGPYAENVARGLDVCVAAIRSGSQGFDAIWNRAFAVQAVADAAASCRVPELLEPVEVGVDRLLHLQRMDGGWSYVYSLGDVPTTAVVMTALGLAAQAGVGVEPTRIEKALRFLEERVDAETHKSEYHHRAEHKGYTPTSANAAGTLAARAALGVLGKTSNLRKRVKAATGKAPKWKIEFKEVETRDGRKVKAQIGNLYPWAWSQAAFAFARKPSLASSWRRSLAAALKKGQVKEGHAKGSWDALGPYSLSGGRAFITALCALMLQEGHRYPREG